MRFSRPIRFCAVGLSGVVVNTATLYLLSRMLHLPILVSSAVAVELAVVSNYLLNNRWTFATRKPSFQGFAKFNAASLVGLSLNVATVWLLTRSGVFFVVANLAGIALGVCANYALSVGWVWRRAA